MNRLKTMVIGTALCAAAFMTTGCAREKQGERASGEYARLVREAVALYARTEPLRSSRIGLTAADSLLFTYSTDEISRALERLKKLEDRFSKLSVAGLPTREVDNAEIIAYWCRGEIFALEELQGFRSNPLGYCWAAEEALWGIPSRKGTPAPGELDAYRARIASIPTLFANARSLLNNPAEAHSRYALERLDSLGTSFTKLDAEVEHRYGEAIDGPLGRARQSVEAFRMFVSDTLLPRSRGRLILGAESLSKVFLYEELINADPNMIVGKAESSMRRLKTQQSSLIKKIEFQERGPALRDRPPAGTASAVRRLPIVARRDAASGADESFERSVRRLLLRLVPDSVGGPVRAADTARLVIRYPARTGHHSSLPTNVLLAVPPAERPPVEVFYTQPFDEPPCLPYCFLSAEATGLSEADLLARLLRATPPALEMDASLCESADTVRAIFSSETFREGWFYVSTRAHAARLRAADPRLGLALLGDEILALARTVVVFRLHAGSMTSDRAAAYLVEAAGLSPEAAAREVLTASISPSVAYRGIAMVLVDGMSEMIAYVDGLEKPERDLQELLRGNRALPLPVINAKISENQNPSAR